MQRDLIRNRLTITERDERHVDIGGKRVINFCSNDYLGIAQHPRVIQAFTKAANQYGVGSSASPIVSGYFKAHEAFEEALAEHLSHERAILFSSGYAANISLMRAIATRHDVIASDKLCHASLLDGIQLSRAHHVRFPHHDFDYAKSLNPSLIVTESVFSMEGDMINSDALLELKQKSNAKVVLDIAHSIGWYNERFSADYTISPLGKSFGSMGATISGKYDAIEDVLQKSKAYHYSTALPPAIAAANLAALTIIQQENWRQEKLLTLIRFFIKEAKNLNIPLISSDMTPIKTILIKDNQQTMAIKEALFNQGYWIGGIRPPTVAPNSARLRISLSSLHEETDIKQLLLMIREIL